MVHLMALGNQSPYMEIYLVFGLGESMSKIVWFTASVA